MCIVCNCEEKGDTFLTAFDQSRRAMARAKEAMRDCGPAYDATHKKMVKLIREWNALEQSREAEHVKTHA